MLIKNSLPVVDGKLRDGKSSEQEIYSRKLIIDKRIILNLLIDL